jgi:predicted dehydrogenase
MRVLLIGTGEMAESYVKVLQNLDVQFEVIGRSEDHCLDFQKKTGVSPISGGIFSLQNFDFSQYVSIVAVGIAELSEVTNFLIVHGSKRILVEKPGALRIGDLIQSYELAKTFGAKVYVAYNRRFYSSVLKARELIEKSGGVRKIHFEFTEFSDEIAQSSHTSLVKNRWILANSSHVLDLFIFLCGSPLKYDLYHKDSLDWHVSGSLFCGAGITDSGALFSFSTDWKAPGRWKIDITTGENRIELKPLEKINILRDLEFQNDPIEDSLDHDFKPGLYRQTDSFLKLEDENLCNIEDQVKAMKFYYEISNYVDS